MERVARTAPTEGALSRHTRRRGWNSDWATSRAAITRTGNARACRSLGGEVGRRELDWQVERAEEVAGVEAEVAGTRSVHVEAERTERRLVDQCFPRLVSMLL